LREKNPSLRCSWFTLQIFSWKFTRMDNLSCVPPIFCTLCYYLVLINSPNHPPLITIQSTELCQANYILILLHNMHSILLFTAALFATGAISQYSSNRDSCNWRETVPSCYFTNSEEAKTGDLVNGWQLKAWAIEGEHENDCPTLVSPDDCCEEDGARSLLGLKRLWCKDSG
jgi:hypothetical protein